MTYPHIDPVLLRIGPLALRWYGLAYVLGFVGAGLLMRRLNRTWKMGLSGDDQLDIVLVAVVGLIVGARVGYMLFYDLSGLLKAPLSIFALWDGGMSFHGGLIGILLAGWLIRKRVDVPFLRLADMGAVGAPIGLFLGRLGNFINGELWGRTTNVPWAMVPPYGGAPRHPSQLYEAILEGLVLFLVMLVLARKRRSDGFQVGVMLALYGVFRIAVEFVREPDAQLGFILGPFTMGQLLSLPVLLAGIWLGWRALRKPMRAFDDNGVSTALVDGDSAGPTFQED
ncbi:MAG: prolipoprotein diacylglyceryl transferase [Coriobacteriia bacterium]|nr:prolipoprotein diacylglyceryl transferase [Coriobacteriia bacterium]